MTDRELLESAAKAAGMKPGHAHGEYAWQPMLECLSTLDERNREQLWNPLEDDGDALRLAVKLHLEIDHNHPMDNDAWVMVRTNGRLDGQTEEIDGEAGRAAATRRAIVRAAAALAA